jgi:hypothetical protein
MTKWEGTLVASNEDIASCCQSNSIATYLTDLTIQILQGFRLQKIIIIQVTEIALIVAQLSLSIKFLTRLIIKTTKNGTNKLDKLQ